MSDDVQPKAGLSPMTRRTILFGVVAVGGAGLFGANWFNVNAQITDAALSVQDAHAKSVAGDIVLIDIRRPDEWSRTGIGEGARPLDMRRDDFTDELLKITAGRTDTPVALICARGVRSRKMSARLTEAGFTQIIDVPEGMLGSGAGPGWLRSKLPVTKP